MNEIYLVLAVIIAISLALVAASAKWPNCRILIAAQQWQTFIGAIVGFIALALTLIMENRITNDRFAKERLSNEMRILESVATDISIFKSRIGGVLDISRSIYSDELGPYRCINLVNIFQQTLNHGISVKTQLPIIAGNISSIYYSEISKVIVTIQLYGDSLLSIKNEDCVTNSSIVRSALIDISSNLISTITDHENRIRNLIARN